MEWVKQYLGVVAAMLFVYMHHDDKSRWMRTGIAVGSGAIGVNVGPELAESLELTYVNTISIVVIGAAYVVFDFAMALLKDTPFLKELIKQRVGKGGR